uniref:Uncharacterized protein n=1 Tax=Arundo donax TaxID=35708 RepID=A0A0A9H8D0_ARUDO
MTMLINLSCLSSLRRERLQFKRGRMMRTSLL